MKIVTIDSSQFDNFAKSHKYRNYYQTSQYGNIMNKFNYEVRYIGIEDDESNLIGASLLLIQDAVMKTKLAYAPRGILFDFTDSKEVEELVTTLKNTLGKEGIVTLRIDPAIPLSIRDNKGNIININSKEVKCAYNPPVYDINKIKKIINQLYPNNKNEVDILLKSLKELQKKVEELQKD